MKIFPLKQPAAQYPSSSESMCPATLYMFFTVNINSCVYILSGNFAVPVQIFFIYSYSKIVHHLVNFVPIKISFKTVDVQ